MLSGVGALREVEVRGRKWSIALIPTGLLATLRAELRDAGREVHALRDSVALPGMSPDAIAQALSEHADFAAAWERSIPALRDAQAQLVRWGLRLSDGWMATEVYQGRTLPVVAAETLDVIAHNEALMADLAQAVDRRNSLTDDEVLGFLPPSGATE